jgi:tRNA-dihydrouridine synthase B
MGCPAPKIVNNGDGSALLKNMENASSIIKACKSATNKPVTVKFRKGFYESDDILIPFAKMCEESGADAITIHPRTTAQGYSGKIDIKDIEKVKNAVKISVIGNGDVTSKEDFDKMLSICDGVMIGRGAVGHPDIFSKVQNSPKTFSQEFIAQKHLDILKKYYDDEYITKIFKRHAFSYVDDRENATTLRVAIARAQTLSEIEQILFNK